MGVISTLGILFTGRGTLQWSACFLMCLEITNLKWQPCALASYEFTRYRYGHIVVWVSSGHWPLMSFCSCAYGANSHCKLLPQLTTFNSLWSCDATCPWCYMPSWHLISIDQIMACRLCGTKPLPNTTQCQFDHWEQTSAELQSKHILFHSFENIVCKMAAIFVQPSVYMINLPADLLLGSRSTKTNPRWQARHNRTSQTRLPSN